MIKRILHYIVTFGSLLPIGYYAHTQILSATEKTLDFRLFDVYVFHAVFSFTICLLILLLSTLPKFAPQLGFLYLGGFLLKFFAFAVVFENIVLSDSPFSAANAVSLLAPIVIFLSLEVYFVAKVLRGIDPK